MSASGCIVHAAEGGNHDRSDRDVSADQARRSCPPKPRTRRGQRAGLRRSGAPQWRRHRLGVESEALTSAELPRAPWRIGRDDERGRRGQSARIRLPGRWPPARRHRCEEPAHLSAARRLAASVGAAALRPRTSRGAPPALSSRRPPGRVRRSRLRVLQRQTREDRQKEWQRRVASTAHLGRPAAH